MSREDCHAKYRDAISAFALTVAIAMIAFGFAGIHWQQRVNSFGRCGTTFFVTGYVSMRVRCGGSSETAAYCDRLVLIGDTCERAGDTRKGVNLATDLFCLGLTCMDEARTLYPVNSTTTCCLSEDGRSAIPRRYAFFDYHANLYLREAIFSVTPFVLVGALVTAWCVFRESRCSAPPPSSGYQRV
jgi:hypothetical protein